MGGGGKGESNGEGGGEDGCKGDVAGKKLLVQRVIVEPFSATYLKTGLASSPLAQHHPFFWKGPFRRSTLETLLRPYVVLA